MLSDTDMKCRPIYRIVKGKFKSIECGLKMLMDFFFLVLSKKNEFRYSFNLFIRCMRYNNAFHYFSDNLRYIITANLLDKGIMDTIKFQTKYPRLQI